MNVAQKEIKKKKKVQIGKGLFILALIIVPLAHFFVFYVYVNFYSFVMAFQTRVGGRTVWTLDNFKLLFQDFSNPLAKGRESIVNTLYFFVMGMFTGLFTSFIISYFLYKKILLANTFRVILFLPSLLSPIVVVQLFSSIVGPLGPIAQLIQKIQGLDQTPELLADSRYALNTLMSYSFWFGIAGNMILLMGALNRIPKDVLEYAKLDGVSWIRELFQIIMPLIWPTMTTLVTVAFTNILSASGPIFLFTQGAYGTYTISYWLWTKVYQMPVNSIALNYGSAIGLFFSLVTLPIVFLVRFVMNKLQEAVEY